MIKGVQSVIERYWEHAEKVSDKKGWWHTRGRHNNGGKDKERQREQDSTFQPLQRITLPTCHVQWNDILSAATTKARWRSPFPGP